MPTTGEFGLWNTFGDYDDHEKIATRIGVHYSHSLENKQRSAGNQRHRQRGGLADDEPRCRRQVQGPVRRGRVKADSNKPLRERFHALAGDVRAFS